MPAAIRTRIQAGAAMLMILVCLLPGGAGAAAGKEKSVQVKESSSAAFPVSEEWELRVIPFGWLVGMDGHVTTKGQKSVVDMKFSDILDILDFAGFIHLELSKRRLSFFTEIMYAKVSDDVDKRLTDNKISLKLGFVEFGAFYRLGDWSLSSPTRDGGLILSLDLMGGGRYTFIDAKLSLKGQGPLGFRNTIKGSEEWVDPIVGGRATLGITHEVALNVRGDVGGFGVGSDFSWNIVGEAVYRFKLWEKEAMLLAGYRWWYADYEDGSGSNKFEWDVTLHGPIIGFSIQF